MSSETDHPRQRTVAELLAAHGDGTATGRRARRRAAENAGQSGPGSASGGYPVAAPNGGDGPGAPPAPASPASAPGSGSFPAVGGARTSGSAPAAPPNSGAFPAVGGLASGPFPAVGGSPAAPNSGQFAVVDGPSAAPHSGAFPVVDSPGSPSGAPAAPGVNGRPAASNGGPGPSGWGSGDNGAPGNGTSGAGGWAPGGGLPNGGPHPGTWSGDDGPQRPANGGPAAWGPGDGSAANGGPGTWGAGDAPHPNGGPGSWGPGSANGNPAGPANWGGDGPPAQDNGGYAAWGAAPDSAVAPPGQRPSRRGRGPRPGGAPEGGGWGADDLAGAPPGRSPGPNGAPPTWRDDPNGAALARRDDPGGAPRNADPAAGRRGGQAGAWGPDSQTDPELHGRADEAEPSSRNGRPAAPRKRQRPNPRRPAPDAHPADGDAAFVNGGAVYPDTEAGHRHWREPDEASGAEATHRIGDRQRAGAPRRRADRTTMLDPGQTGPIAPQPLADDDGGPSTAVGLAPAGAEDWHRDRTARRGAWNGGSPTDGSAPFSLDDDQDEYDDADDYRGETDRVGHLDRHADDPDDHPAGLPAEPKVRSAGSSAGQAWAAVVAQWIAGAIGGAALWVGFRFLWRDLPVVALAAAVLVTVGLVLVVRALMHNDDRRTTLFAVLVGLLLTVSPAILVLLGR